MLNTTPGGAPFPPVHRAAWPTTGDAIETFVEQLYFSHCPGSLSYDWDSDANEDFGAADRGEGWTYVEAWKCDPYEGEGCGAPTTGDSDQHFVRYDIHAALGDDIVIETGTEVRGLIGRGTNHHDEDYVYDTTGLLTQPIRPGDTQALVTVGDEAEARWFDLDTIQGAWMAEDAAGVFDDDYIVRCEHADDDDRPDSVEGPMMNYWYPIDTLGEGDMVDAALRLVDHSLCVVQVEGTVGLALTGGGMDMTWDICRAFIAVGYLPPLSFCDLPGMAGENDPIVIAACRRAAAAEIRSAERLVAKLDALVGGEPPASVRVDAHALAMVITDPDNVDPDDGRVAADWVASVVNALATDGEDG